MPAFDRTLLRTPRTTDPDGLLYVPELVPVVTPPGGVMTRPWLDWARRLTAKLAEVGTGGGGGGGGAPAAHHGTHEPGGTDALQLTGGSRLFGRGASGAGAVQEVTLGANLSMTGTTLHAAGGGTGGGGDVVGPAGATADALALFSGTTGKLIKDSLKTIAALTADILAAVLPGGLLPLSALPAHHTRHEPGGSDPMAVDAAAATGSLRTLGAGANQAAPGNDARFTAPSTPTAHATTHQPGGSDAMAVDAVAATGSLRTLGPGAQQAAPGNDARLTNARTPTAHATTHQPGGSDAMAVDAAAAVGSLRTLGTGATQAAPGNDARFTTVVAHHVTHEPGGSDALQLSAASRLVGRGSVAGAGAVQEITLGPGLAMSDTVLTMTTGAGVGDVFGPASATPDNLAAYADPTGKVIKDAGIPTAQVARRDQANSFVHADQRIYSNGQPRLTIVDNFQPASQRAFRVINTAQALSVQALDDALTTVQATPLALTRAGNATVGNHLTVTGNGTVTGTGGNVACKDQANVFTAPAQQIGPGTAPRLSFYDAGPPTDARVFRIMNSAQVLEFSALNDAQSAVLATPLLLTRGGDVLIGRDLYEKGRTTPMGHWQDVSYSAGNFFATGGSAPTWTLGAVTTYAYTLIGKTLLISIVLSSMTVAGSPGTLYATLPAGFTVARHTVSPVNYYDAVAGPGVGIGTAPVGAYYVSFTRDMLGTAWGNGAMHVHGTFTVTVA